jgi:hypothetical protein
LAVLGGPQLFNAQFPDDPLEKTTRSGEAKLLAYPGPPFRQLPVPVGVFRERNGVFCE